jgi:hypothetical protein
MRIERLVAAFAAICLLVPLAVLLLDRQADAERVPSLVRARAIELVDGRGQVRAQIRLDRDREVVFRLRDQDGTIRVKLGASRAGSGLLLLNEATEPGVHALARAKETSLSLQRGEQRTVVVP